MRLRIELRAQRGASAQSGEARRQVREIEDFVPARSGRCWHVTLYCGCELWAQAFLFIDR